MSYSDSVELQEAGAVVWGCRAVDGLFILLEHFQKLHISATRQQKAPTGFLCSFIAGSGKEMKRIGDCFPGSLV